MPVPDNSRLYDVLQRAIRGECSHPDVAEALIQSPEVALLNAPPGQIGPPFVGTLDREGKFYANAFTKKELAANYAEIKGIAAIGSDDVVQETTWLNSLEAFLQNRIAGVIIDQGTENQVHLSRKDLVTIFELWSLDFLAELQSVYVSLAQDALYLQKNRQGNIEAFAFSSAESMRIQGGQLQQQVHPLYFEEMHLVDYLGLLIRNQVHRLHLDPLTATPKQYSAHLIFQAHRALKARQARESENLLGLRLRQEATKEPFPSWEPRKKNSRPALAESWQTAQAKYAAPWEFLTLFLEGLPVHMPLHPSHHDGLRWPQVLPHPVEPQDQTCYLFTNREQLQKWQRLQDSTWRHSVQLSGLEAVRWALAATPRVDHLLLDFEASQSIMSITRGWAQSLLFPATLQAGPLRNLTAMSREQIGTRPFVSILYPPLLKAILESDSTMEYKAGRKVQKLAGNTELDSWEQWRQECVAQGEVRLAPRSQYPLRISPMELVAGYLWGQRDRQPSLSEIVRQAAQWQVDGHVDVKFAGRVAAGIPHLYILSRGGELDPLFWACLPDSDSLAVFTSRDAALLWARESREQGHSKQTYEVVPVASRWQNSLIRTAAEEFDAVIVDSSLRRAGLFIDSTGLQTAVTHQEELLRPRAPQFAAK